MLLSYIELRIMDKQAPLDVFGGYIQKGSFQSCLSVEYVERLANDFEVRLLVVLQLAIEG